MWQVRGGFALVLPVFWGSALDTAQVPSPLSASSARCQQCRGNRLFTVNDCQYFLKPRCAFGSGKRLCWKLSSRANASCEVCPEQLHSWLEPSLGNVHFVEPSGGWRRGDASEQQSQGCPQGHVASSGCAQTQSWVYKPQGSGYEWNKLLWSRGVLF